MTKEEKVQLKYVERLAKDCPIYFDERQKFFFSALDVIKGKMKGTSVISMGGFPAGHVNLGWLSDKSEKAAGELGKKYGVDYVSRVITILIEKTVQRLKTLSVVEKAHIESLEVKFETKDDHNWYSYGFLVPIEKGGKEKK